MATEETAVQIGAEERALLTGDLAKLDAAQRASLYQSVCKSLGLNPLTQPFSYLTLNGKLVLYAKKDCTDQLRAIHGISVRVGKPEIVADVLYVSAHASTATGRTDEDLGAVSVGGLRGEALANAHMKAITKAKRRVTLSIAGLGMLDENEIESIPGATRIEEYAAPQLNPHNANPATGEIPVEDRPAGQQRVDRLLAVTKELFDLTGESVDIPDAPTVAECNKLGREVQVKLTAAKAERAARIDTAQSLAGVP